MLPGTKVGHVLISQFSERSTENVAKAVGELKSQGAQALILDLRNDPGGLRDEAIGVASQFLKQGNVLVRGQRPGPAQDLSGQAWRRGHGLAVGRAGERGHG